VALNRLVSTLKLEVLSLLIARMHEPDTVHLLDRIASASGRACHYVGSYSGHAKYKLWSIVAVRCHSLVAEETFMEELGEAASKEDSRRSFLAPDQCKNEASVLGADLSRTGTLT
jgi:hypothetical protein